MKKLIILFLLVPLFVFAQTKIKFNQVNPTLPANFNISNSGKILGADSIYLGTQNTYATPTGSITFLGTSITVGVGVTGSGVRYSTQVATALGLTEINKGMSGSTVEKRSPTNIPNFIDSLAIITTYSAGVTRWLVIETGPNDFNLASANYNATNYQTDLTTVVNYAIFTKGWPASKILLLSNSYVNSALFNGTTKTPTIYAGFIAADQAVATATGTLYLNVNNWFNSRGGNYIMYDNLHPNNLGHTTESNAVLSVLSPSIVYKKGQNLAVNGVTELSNIKLANTTNATDASQTLVGIDASGNLSKLSAIPANIRTAGISYLGGGLIDTGLVYTNVTPTVNDWILGQKKIYTQFGVGGGYFTTLNLCNSLIGFEFKTSLDLSSNIMATFYNGAGGAALQIQQNGDLYPLRHFVATYGSNSGFITSYNLGSGSVSGFMPFMTDFSTQINNAYTNGFITISTSHGTTGSLFEAARFAKSGDMLIGGTIDNGFPLDVTGAARVSSTFGIGKLADPTLTGNPTTSTTGGTIAAGTHYYVVAGVDAFGNITNYSNQGQVTTTGSTSSNTINWNVITNATSVRIYHGTSSLGENQYLTASAGTTSIVDIGSGYTSGSLPTQNKTVLAGISNLGVISSTSLTASQAVYTDASKNLISKDPNTSLITGTPTIVAGAGAGTSPTVSVTTNGKQLQVTVTTGTLPTGTNATVATVTLPNPLTYTPLPVFSGASATTALLSGASMIYMTSSGTANVTITSGTTALTAATTYVWNISL